MLCSNRCVNPHTFCIIFHFCVVNLVLSCPTHITMLLFVPSCPTHILPYSYSLASIRLCFFSFSCILVSRFQSHEYEFSWDRSSSLSIVDQLYRLANAEEALYSLQFVQPSASSGLSLRSSVSSSPSSSSPSSFPSLGTSPFSSKFEKKRYDGVALYVDILSELRDCMRNLTLGPSMTISCPIILAKSTSFISSLNSTPFLHPHF